MFHKAFPIVSVGAALVVALFLAALSHDRSSDLHRPGTGQKYSHFWVGVRSRFCVAVHNKWEWTLLISFLLTIVALGIWWFLNWDKTLPDGTKVQPSLFMMRLATGLLTAYVVMFGARRLASAQSAPALLSRINDDSYYAIRRKLWKETMVWFAGDRYWVVSHLLSRHYPLVLGLKPSGKDRSITLNQLLGFVAELQ
ncbi:MAG: hypothetical protein AAF539_16290, partial [Planctomycetota bacterium]